MAVRWRGGHRATLLDHDYHDNADQEDCYKSNDCGDDLCRVSDEDPPVRVDVLTTGARLHFHLKAAFCNICLKFFFTIFEN